MKFLRLDVRAFKRFREPFSLSLDNQGLVLVEGENRDGGGVVNSNGSGKSLAVVEAPLWCLYGKMARYGGRLVTDEVVHPAHGAEVSIMLETRGGQYQLTRSRSLKGSPQFAVTSAVDGLGRVAISRDPSRRADAVAALLGFDYNAFRYAVVVQGGDSLARAGFTTQMAVLEAILRMDELSAAEELARKRASATDRELAGLRVEVKVRRQACDQSAQLLEQVRASGTTDYAAEIEALEKELQDVEEAARLLPGVRDALATATASWDRAQRETAAKRGEWGAASRELETAWASLRSAVCPTCKRPLKDAGEQTALEKTVEQLRKQAEDARKAAQTAETRVAAAQNKKQAIDQEVRGLEARVAQGDGLRAQVDLLQRQQEEFAQLVAQAEAQAAEARAALEEAEQRLAPLEERYQRLQFWVAGYGRDGLQADIFSSAVPVLNAAAARYCQLLMAGVILVTFNPIRGTRTDDLIRIDGASAPTYDGLSRGEKERVDLVITLALRDLARWRLPEPVNLSVFDEVFDHIDEAGLRVVARLLQEETREGGSTFVVTHNAAMKALFPGARVLRVIRQGGEAEVRYVS